jgi:hypothetical protein
MRSGAGDPGWKLIVIVGGAGTWAGLLTDASKASPSHAEDKVRAQRIPRTVKPRFFDDHRSVSLAATPYLRLKFHPARALATTARQDSRLLAVMQYLTHHVLQRPMISPIGGPVEPKLLRRCGQAGALRRSRLWRDASPRLNLAGAGRPSRCHQEIVQGVPIPSGWGGY